MGMSNFWMPETARWVHPGKRRRAYHDVIGPDDSHHDAQEIVSRLQHHVVQIDAKDLRARREALGMTQVEVADLAGTSQANIQNWETRATHPRPEFATWWLDAIRKAERGA